MQPLSKLYRLSSVERELLVKAALLLVVIRVGLWALPFRTLRGLLNRAATPHELRKPDCQSADTVAWAVEAAAKRMPGFSTCLTKALATQMLLSRRERSALLRIGVARNEEGEFEAHAWIESEGRVVIGGGRDLVRYTPLSTLEREIP